MLNYESIFNSFLFIFPIILFLEKTKKSSIVFYPNFSSSKNTHSFRLPIALSVLLFVARVSSSRHHCRRSLAVPGLLGNTLSLSAIYIIYGSLSLSTIYGLAGERFPGACALGWRGLCMAWPASGSWRRRLGPAWPVTLCMACPPAAVGLEA